MLREGLTNPEIAGRLGISRDGAKYHVSEILTKLGLTSRVEAAAWQPAGHRPWWAASVFPFVWLWRRAPGAVPTAAMVAGVAVILAALGGLAFMTYLLVNSDGDAADEPPAVAGAPFDIPARPEDNVLYVVDQGGGEPLALATSGTIVDAQWSPNGDQLAYITEEATNLLLATVDASGGEQRVLRTIDDPTSSIVYLWSPGGEIALLVEGAGELLTAGGEQIATFRASDLIEWSPDGGGLLVWNAPPGSASATIAVVDGATGESRTLAEGSTQWPRAAAWSPDGSQVAHPAWMEDATCTSPTGSSPGDFMLNVVDVATGASRTVLGPSCAAGFAGYDWSPDGQRIAFTAPGVPGAESEYERGAYVLDLASGDVTQITSDVIDFDVRWLPDGEHLAVTRANCWQCDGDQWWALVTDEGEQLAEWAGGYPGLGIAGDGARVAVGTVGGELLLSTPDDPAGTPLFAAPPLQFRNVAWSPDGERIAFVRWPGNKTSAYTASPSANAVEPIGLPYPAVTPTISPDLARIAYVNGSRALVVAPASDAANGVEVAQNVTAGLTALAWSTDGAWLAFLRQSDFPTGDLVVASADGRQLHVVLPEIDIGDPKIVYSWRPGTTQLLVSGQSSGLAQPTLIDIESGERTPFDVASGDWSPDGSQIAYVDGRDLLVLDAAGGESRSLLTLRPSSNAVAAWSPDGGTVAVLEVAADGILWLADADGGEPRQAAVAVPPTRTVAGEYQPDLRSYASRPSLRWSPDGSTIALNFVRDDGHGVFLFDVASEELMPVSLSARSDRRHLIAGWSADGDALGIVSEWCFGSCP